MQIDIREFFKPEDRVLRYCSFLIVTTLNGGTDDEIRSSAVAPDYQYLGAALATVLFSDTTLDATKVAILKTVSESVAPTEAWNRSTLSDMPIDTVVKWDDGPVTISISITALIDHHVGPCKVDAVIKEKQNDSTE